MLRAKRAIETLVATGTVFIELPTVESSEALAAELARAGIAAAPVELGKPIDVLAIRERLGLTQVQFALRYGLDRDAVRQREAGSRDLDSAARSYLRAISNDPEHVEQAYAPTPELPKSA